MSELVKFIKETLDHERDDDWYDKYFLLRYCEFKCYKILPELDDSDIMKLDD